MSDSVERILAAIAALSEEDRDQLLRRLAQEELLSEPPQQEPMALDFTADEFEGHPDYVLIFDGGSKGNPGPGYGSYALQRKHDGKQRLIRLDFGRQMTNNEAEYEALIGGLQGLIERIELADRSPKDFSLEIRGDSKLVLNQVRGDWKAKDDRMRLLRNRVRELLAHFKAYKLIHHNREESVQVLGH